MQLIQLDLPNTNSMSWHSGDFRIAGLQKRPQWGATMFCFQPDHAVEQTVELPMI